jgi:transposase InsO family protein
MESRNREIRRDLVLSAIQYYRIRYRTRSRRIAEGISASPKYSLKLNVYEVKRIVHENPDLLIRLPKQTTIKYNNWFMTRSVVYLWHTGLYYLKNMDLQWYLIAFIDDRGRFLLFYEILLEKIMIATNDAVIHALQSYIGYKIPLSVVMTWDNSGEFTGSAFQQVLAANNIDNCRTHPYTPQENWEMERF